MKDNPLDPLQLAYEALRTRFQITEVGRKGSMIVLQVGRSKDAAMAISINDPSLPSFDVLYPKTTIKRDGERRVEAAHSNRVLLEGLQWIAEQLSRNGSVLPEFSD